MMLMKTLKLTMAVAIPSSMLLAAGAAEARGRLLPKLVRSGSLAKADLAGLKQIRMDVRACRKAVRGGAQPKGSCLPKIIEEAQARKALFQKALPNVQKPRLQKKVTRALKKLDRRIAKLQARAAGGTPAPAPVPPPAQ